MQTAFGRGGGLPLLVGLLDTAVTPKPGARQQLAAVTQGAVDALAVMTRNHAENRCCTQASLRCERSDGHVQPRQEDAATLGTGTRVGCTACSSLLQNLTKEWTVLLQEAGNRCGRGAGLVLCAGHRRR